MRKLRKINIFYGTLLCIFLQMSSVQGDELWKIGHVRPAGSAVDLDVHKFIESIAKNSQEKIHLHQIAQDFAALPRYKVPLQETDIQGLTALQYMATLLEQAGL